MHGGFSPCVKSYPSGIAWEWCIVNSMLFKRKSPLFIFLIPAFAFMTVFLFYPFLVNIYNSLCRITALGAKAGAFVGLANYKTMAADPLIRTSLINTLIMMALTIVFQVGIALVLALLVDSIRKGAQFFRTVYFFPIVISATALGLLFDLMLLYTDGYPGGMVNQLLVALGMHAVDFKSSNLAFITLCIPVLWQYVGFYFVIILAGIGGIPEDVFESAAMDGATGWKKIRYITLPMLYNVLVTCLILSVTGALKVFDLPWTMFPSGIPFNSTYLLGTYMYQQTFEIQSVGYGSAISVLIVALGVVLSQVVNGVFKTRDY